MVPLFLLSATLLAASGLMKLKAAARVGMGLPVPVLVELLGAVGIFGLMLATKLTRGQGLAVVVGTVALVVASSLHVGLEVRRRQRIRAASEGARLAVYLKPLPSETER